jgi:hypothetical protein
MRSFCKTFCVVRFWWVDIWPLASFSTARYCVNVFQIILQNNGGQLAKKVGYGLYSVYILYVSRSMHNVYGKTLSFI